MCSSTPRRPWFAVTIIGLVLLGILVVISLASLKMNLDLMTATAAVATITENFQHELMDQTSTTAAERTAFSEEFHTVEAERQAAQEAATETASAATGVAETAAITLTAVYLQTNPPSIEQLGLTATSGYFQTLTRQTLNTAIGPRTSTPTPQP